MLLHINLPLKLLLLQIISLCSLVFALQSPKHLPTRSLPSSTSSTIIRMTPTESSQWVRVEGDPHVETVLFVECGWGNDSHGQDVTKAAVRACRNAIEFNSIPSVQRLVPNGYDGLRLDVVLAVPAKYREGLDLSKVADVFPYGSIRFQLQDGGMIAPSGIAIDRLGDKNEDMVVLCCAVTIGY
jgi:uncharacterized protein (TIGR02058 family)